MKKELSLLILGFALLLCGLFSWQLRTGNALSSAQPLQTTAVRKADPQKDASIQGEPAQLMIPSLAMSLPVIDGAYNAQTHQWTLTTDKVQYAVSTPLPNNKAGNTFIYGHYRPEVFARLHTIKAGATAYVTTQNGHTFSYQLSSVKVVNPDDTSLLRYKGPPTLTLQTCSGLFFQHRQIFTFKLLKAV